MLLCFKVLFNIIGLYRYIKMGECFCKINFKSEPQCMASLNAIFPIQAA